MIVTIYSINLSRELTKKGQQPPPTLAKFLFKFPRGYLGINFWRLVNQEVPYHMAQNDREDLLYKSV